MSKFTVAKPYVKSRTISIIFTFATEQGFRIHSPWGTWFTCMTMHVIFLHLLNIDKIDCK